MENLFKDQRLLQELRSPELRVLRGPDAGAEATSREGRRASLGAAGRTPSKRWEAYVLNMRRNPKRLRGFLDAVREQEPWILPRLRRVSAVDGQAILANRTAREELLSNGIISRRRLDEALENAGGAARWEELSPGAVGLYLSHAIAWHHVGKGDLDYGLVFEDDLRFFSDDFKRTVDEILKNDTVVDFAYFQHCEDTSGWARGSSVRPSGVPRARFLVSEEEEIVPCTAAYLLSRRAALALLELAFPITKQLDRALCDKDVTGPADRPELKRVIFEPALAQVGPESFTSTVQMFSWSTWFNELRCSTTVGRVTSFIVQC